MISVDQFKQAAWEGDFDVVKRYVEDGGDVNACASNGVNALVSLNTQILDYLYMHQADPRVIWNDGNPAICFHAWELNIDGVKWFLEKSVDPNIEHLKTGENCLHSLTAKPLNLAERLELIELLVKYGADVNRQTKTGVVTGNFMRDVRVVGETPLHRAAAYQSRETIEYLLSQGADKTIKDSRGESPLSWASRHWRSREILKILQYGKYEGSIL